MDGTQWLITVLISFVAVCLTAAAFIYGRRKDGRNYQEARDDKVAKEATERAEVKEALRHNSDKLDQMDRNINDKLSRMEGQYDAVNRCTQDHEQRLVRVEESTKSAHQRINELKLKEE